MIKPKTFSAVHAPTQARAALFFAFTFCVAVLFQNNVMAAKNDEISRGKYIFNLSGCAGCHTDKKSSGALLAGGRKFKTEFGTFYSPNITPDKKFGIGKWNYADFTRAMREGISPDGSNYYPSFPYTSYSKMSDDDLSNLWAYLKSIPANSNKNIEHDLKPPFSWRFLIWFWKILNFNQNPLPAVEGKSQQWERGRYITEALTHCRECHTPRNIFGGLAMAMDYAGTNASPEGITVPNITSDKETGIGKWSASDIDFLLKMGMLPDADFVSGIMAESVSHSTSKMTNPDRAAVIEYLRAIAPVENSIKSKAKASSSESWQ